MKRALWQQQLTRNYCPPWPCPICRKGVARLRRDSLVYQETVESKRAHDNDDWGPEYIEFKFTAWADCINESCKQGFAIAGTGGIEQVFDDENETTEWIESFIPKYISPAPQLLDIPTRCPSSVRDQLYNAFQLYWADAEACAGRLRTSLEALLTHVGVPVQNYGAKADKARKLTLHARIECESSP